LRSQKSWKESDRKQYGKGDGFHNSCIRWRTVAGSHGGKPENYIL
jgi:hypothetical protein